MSFQAAVYSFDETSSVVKKKKEREEEKNGISTIDFASVNTSVCACIISRNKWKGG